MENEIWSNKNDNVSKYEHFTRKISKPYSHPPRLLAISAVLSFLYHHCCLQNSYIKAACEENSSMNFPGSPFHVFKFFQAAI